jgi:hypothetical protein
MISRLDPVSVFSSIFTIFEDFRTPFRGVFWDKNVKKWSMEKQAKKESEIFRRALQDLIGHPPCGPLKQFKNIPEWGMGHTTCPRNTPLVPRRHGGEFTSLGLYFHVSAYVCRFGVILLVLGF